MNRISVENILKKIKAGQIDLLYYLTGAEKFFHDQIIALLTDRVFPDKGSRDLNLTVLYGTENTQAELLTAVLSYPMLAKQKLVIVRDFDKMKISDSEAFEKYLKKLNQTTCLVLSAQEKGKNKITKIIEEVAQNIDCTPIPEYKLSGWYLNFCRQRGISMDQQTVTYLINQVGSNLLTLNQEITKIIDFKNEITNITIEDIEQITGISREVSVFALQKSLARRQLGQSLKIGKQLLEAGQNINYITAVLFAFFRKLLIVASLKEKGKQKQEIVESLNLSDFQFKEINETLNNFSMTQLKKAIKYLHEVDLASKTSTIDDGSGLQMLCYKICRI